MKELIKEYELPDVLTGTKYQPSEFEKKSTIIKENR
jgi:hypothetical protein